jgi:FkbH-like protein
VPEIFVPEIPEDPALVPRCLADSGAFEMVALTEEDLRRTELYATNIARDKLLHEATNLEAFLIGLDMRLIWRKVTDVDIARVTQLINKTNQFNLTTRRLGEDEVRKVMHDGRCAALQFRLIDRLADHGIIAVVMGHLAEEATFVIDDWLMSCRVIGRGVEAATLNVVAAQAKALGAATLLASYRPTGRNGMVADLLARLGFEVTAAADQSVAGSLDLVSFTARETAMRIEEAA